MKIHLKISMAVSLMVLTTAVHAQQIIDYRDVNPIREISLGITDKKTTNLIFPFSIKSVDRGNPDVLVQRAKNVENILQIKAGSPDFESTNLTVVTSEGMLHSFSLFYEEHPVHINLAIGNGERGFAKFTDPGDDDRFTKRNADIIAVKKRTLWGVSDNQYGMDLLLKGIFIQDDRLYFQLQIENRSLIRYDIGQFRIYIRDMAKAKRTASQEIELLPESIHGNTRFVAGYSSQTIVFALSKLTIPDKKYLCVEFLEDNGGRHLKLKIRNKKLIRALPVW